MKKSIIKCITALLLAVLMITSIVPANGTKAADKAVTKQSGVKLGLTSGPVEIKGAAGSTINVAQTFTLLDEHSLWGSFNVEPEKGSPVSISDISYKYLNDQVSVNGEQIAFSEYNEVVVTYKVKISEYATVGTYEYAVKFDGGYYHSEKDPETGERLPSEYIAYETGDFIIQVNVTSEKTAPTFKLVSDPYISANAGGTVTVVFEMKNVGELDAYETYIALQSHSALIPVDTVMNQRVGLISAGQTCRVSYKFKVAADTETQTIPLDITTSSKTLSGAERSHSDYKIYVNVKGNEPTATPTPTPLPEVKESSLIVSKVSHSPEAPQAGEQMTVKFRLENNGDENLTNVKVMLADSSVGIGAFEPISSDPYTYVGAIDARKSKDVSLKIKLGDHIVEGTNKLNLVIESENKDGIKKEAYASVYILNVVGKEAEEASSKPKLMVTEFSTDVETIMSGKTFEFRFAVKNTNDETRAKNIKVKVTSSEFSVTSGSNSFFISEIKPGESSELSINLKASAAAATGAYPITVSMEYEYDGMPTSSGYDSSVSASDELLLQINETLRASLENIQVGDWNTPVVGSATTATFEFYNMGRSVLNNVYVTIEGDFILATGDSYYMGNMQPGMPEYTECSVIPMVEGDATCIFVIHMEDSNGDEVTSQHQTTVYVSNGEIYDPGFDPWIEPGVDPVIDPEKGEIIGYDEFGNPIYANDNPANGSGIKAIFAKYKLYILIGAGVIVVGVIVGTVCAVKHNKKKKEAAEFDD